MHGLKMAFIFEVVSVLICSNLEDEKTQHLFLDICLPQRCFRFIIDYSSRVHPFESFSKSSFHRSSRIAIWNKNKIVVAIATSLWITNVVVMARGKSSRFSAYRQYLMILYQVLPW